MQSALRTIVLGLFSSQLVGRLRADVREHLVDPFAQLALFDAVGDKRERRLSVGRCGVFGQTVGVEVLLIWDRGRGVERVAETPGGKATPWTLSRAMAVVSARNFFRPKSING